MIYNDEHYKVSEARLAELRETLVEFEKRMPERSWIKRTQINSLKGLISDIEEEMAEYDRLKSGKVSFSEARALEELPRTLVRARVASGMSQADLAERLGMELLQLRHYEDSDYLGASLGRLTEIAGMLGVSLSTAHRGSPDPGGPVFTWSGADDAVWKRLPCGEMERRGWFAVPPGGDPQDAAREYFIRAAGPRFAAILRRQGTSGGDASGEYALLAWQARVLEKARESVQGGGIAEFQLNDQWLPRLAGLTVRGDGPMRAKRMLAERGIPLVIERRLPGTRLDVAAMLSEEDAPRPVIGLTLRRGGLDDFWFALLRGLGRVFLQLFAGQSFVFFDEDIGAECDEAGRRADEYALGAQVPEEAWRPVLPPTKKARAEAEKAAARAVSARIRRECGGRAVPDGLSGPA